MKNTKKIDTKTVLAIALCISVQIIAMETENSKYARLSEYVLSEGQKIVNESDVGRIVNSHLSESHQIAIRVVITDKTKNISDATANGKIKFSSNYMPKDIRRDIEAVKRLKDIYYGDRKYSEREISNASYPSVSDIDC